MSDYDSFDERTFFAYVDNPSITYAKDADLIKEEYKETPVFFDFIYQ